MKRRCLCMLLCVWLIGAAVIPCAFAEEHEAGFRVIVASDLHYISPAICDFGPYFRRMMDEADSKLTRYCEELTDAFLAEVIDQRPDALLLTGDLSFNGARESHAALAEKLRQLEAAGVPVLVLTGNHDVYNRNAARIEGEGFTRLTPCDSETFRTVYAEFGFDEALNVDTDSLSYLCPVNESTWALMLDFNTAHDFCGISEASLVWVRQQLELARAEGRVILAAGHQNLYAHSAFTYGYVIDGAEALAALLREYEVPLFLSGHLHIQHWQTVDGLTEIAASALSVAPCQYAVLTCSGGSWDYRTRETDVAAWAKAQGLDDPVLAEFPAYGAAVMDMHTARETEGELKALGYSSDKRREMIDYACRLNRAYFSGDLTQWETWDPDGHITALWASTGSLRDYYMRSVVPDFGHDYRAWRLEA